MCSKKFEEVITHTHTHSIENKGLHVYILKHPNLKFLEK